MAEILFLAHRIPFPPDRGDKMRSWHLLRHLGTLARVHLACFADDAADAAGIAPLREAMGGALGEAHVEIRRKGKVAAARALAQGRPLSLALFDSAALRGFVERLLAARDIGTIFAFSGQMAQFVPEPSGRRFVMDFVDMDSAKFADYGAAGRGPRAWLYRREARRLRAFERATAERADISLFVTDAEVRLFRERAAPGRADIRTLGNGIDLVRYDPAADFARLDADTRGQGPMLVFTGQMDYRPNVEAVTAFAHGVMPRVRRNHPDARFAIVGRNPTPVVRRLHGRNGTYVTGAVDDVRSWLAAADLAVAPLLIARGVQNKLLEAMAMAKPVVASPAAFEGIEAEAGRELFVADGADAQAQAVCALLADPLLAKRTGAAARRRVERAYGWEARLAPLADMVLPSRRRAAA